ncbi:hypothetical protein AGMMS50256_25820 [Betaproteobacteria bacterium]|nr:hypothetical protein AGMMS50256_25820 [Betaproteobacteria bacterium]
MKTQLDLFPETLTTYINKEGKVVSNSLILNKLKGMLHKNLLQIIRQQLKYVPEAEQELNIKLLFSVYTAANGAKKRTPYYEFDEVGFGLIASSFTGEDGARLRWKILKSYEDARKQLAVRDRRYTRAFDKRCPGLIAVVEMTQKDMNRAQIAGAIGKSPASVTYRRHQARHLGLLPH